MNGLVGWAQALVLLALVAIAAAAILLAGIRDWAVALALANSLLLALSGLALIKARQAEFSMAAGALLVMDVSALALLSGQGVAVVWAAFGVGLLALMAGNHTCRSAAVLTVRREGDGAAFRAFRKASLRGYLRIMVFVGMVLLVSLFILLLALNAAIGTMPSWAFAALALAAMVAFALLARSRHTEG